MMVKEKQLNDLKKTFYYQQKVNLGLFINILFINNLLGFTQCICSKLSDLEPGKKTDLGKETDKTNESGKIDEAFIEKINDGYLKGVLRSLQQGNHQKLDQTDWIDRTPLLLGVIEPKNNIAILKYLLKKGQGDVNAPNSYGARALHWAVERKKYKPEVVNFLLDQGAKIDIQDNYKRTPIEAAIDSDNMPGLELLVTRGADVNLVCDNLGHRPLQVAKQKNNQAMVNFLLQHKATE
jgi:ankyrin repeat protein